MVGDISIDRGREAIGGLPTSASFARSLQTKLFACLFFLSLKWCFYNQIAEEATIRRPVNYDLSGLTQSNYDRQISDAIERCAYVDYVEDALFFDDPSDVVVYWNCDADEDLDLLLTKRHLWGFGNGHIVRGSVSLTGMGARKAQLFSLISIWSKIKFKWTATWWEGDRTNLSS